MQHPNFKFRWLYVMVILYIAAGTNHFINPGMYISIMPHFLSYKPELVYISGIFEILLGLLLIPKKFRKLAAWGIVLLLIAIFPANIQMAIDYYKSDSPSFWIAILRLPLQFVLIRWAYMYTRKRPSIKNMQSS